MSQPTVEKPSKPPQAPLDSGLSSPTPKPVSDQQLSAAEKNYKLLKRKLKYLLYEQEALAEDLRKCRRKVLRITKEKEYLLDRLLRHEDVLTSEDEGSSGTEPDSDDIPLAKESKALTKRRAEEREKSPIPSKTPTLEVKVKRRSKKHKEKEVVVEEETPKEDPPVKTKGSRKKSDPRCRAQPCKMKPLTGLNYCRNHSPLDPNSGFIYCTFRDAQTKAQTCKAVVKRGLTIPLCPIHRRIRNETASPAPASSPGPSTSSAVVGTSADDLSKLTRTTETRDVVDDMEDDVDDED